MSERIVTTQAELDAALAEKVDYIEIRSERGVWLKVAGNRGNSSVVARGNSSVVARENSSVVAWENSSVEAWGNSSVVAWGNSSVVAWGNSSVEAWGNSGIHRYGRGKTSASRSVAVWLHTADATTSGGVIIDVSKPVVDAADWCAEHGVTVSKAGVATLYKAVDDAWTTSRGTSYAPGSKPSAPDWRADDQCGGGLHFGPTPSHAKDYNYGATRFVAAGVKVSEMQVIPGGVAKVKAPRVVRACVEVDLHGRPVTS